MNLAKLFQLQRQLDERIEKEHPVQPGENRLAKKILALMAEKKHDKHWAGRIESEYLPHLG